MIPSDAIGNSRNVAMTMMHLKIMLGLACDMRSLVQARDSVGEGGGDMNAC
jgi:hypothetical protein